jgi:hypothetical protein
MNISEETPRILHDDRSARSKKAAATLRKRCGKDYFNRQGAKGGLKPKRRSTPPE